VFPTPFKDQLNRFNCRVSASYRVSDYKISGANLSFIPLKIS